MNDLPPHERLRQRAEQAAVACSRDDIENYCNETANTVLMGLARNPHLQERDLLRLLERKDLSCEVVSKLASRPEVRRSYALKLAMVRHPRMPRSISASLLKFLYVFDLLRVAQTPGVSTDVKIVAEETILKKLAGMPRGERISLARRGTGRLAASLLNSPDAELVRAGLDNPYLTEGHLVKLLAREDLPPTVLEQLAQHKRWSHYYDLRLALIRNPLTPFARVLEFLPDMAVTDLRYVCLDHRLLPPVRRYIEAYCAARLKKPSGVRPAE